MILPVRGATTATSDCHVEYTPHYLKDPLKINLILLIVFNFIMSLLMVAINNFINSSHYH